ncbi:MAG: squalene/phytoene synthase family protein [Elusimicrobia bacterium]|nr:squalene/phytoene synthase family protein [Elusimicrobiota bacterium]
MISDALLRGVSRSFYLSLRVLPVELREPVSLAYLLARASDTVADTQAVARARRLELLRSMKEGDFRPVSELAEGQSLPAERLLLESLDACAAVLQALPSADRDLVRSLLGTIVSGQIEDLERFPGESPAELAALPDDAALDRYAYLVAGCVGEFWTRMCAAHLPAFQALDQAEMLRLGARLGKGLQLVNILRDLAADLRLGRCYLPVREPRRFLDPARFPELRQTYGRWLDEAVGHLDAGWEYVRRLPPGLWRVRLACVWPIWIGLATVALLRRANPLDPARRAMVPQWRVNLFLAQSLLCVRSQRLLDPAYRSLRGRALT